MCGIAGIVSFNDKAINSGLITKMIDTISHRGPDDEGVYIGNLNAPHNQADQQSFESAVGNVCLGHKRLSIIDLSREGRQPLSNEDKSIWLVCNGEIYNYNELAKNLLSKGHKLKSKTDCEVIIHLYEDYGDSFINYLRGMFAFGLWDGNKNRLIVARDRVGIKPLYYYYKENKLIFASEMKAILANPDVKKEVDITALNQYLSLLYVPAPRTIFNGISKVKPGCMLTLEDGKLRENQYWDLTFDDTGSKQDVIRSEKYYADAIYDILKESIKIRMMSDVPLGAFLSGGIDSSVIVGIMSELSNEPIKTFSIGFGKEERHYDELKYAKVVADKFNTEHREFIVKSDIVNLLPTVVGHFDEPFANPTAVLMYLLSEETKKHVTVALSGTGGDEAFSGYTRYAGMKLSEYASKVPKPLRSLVRFAASKVPESADGRHIGRRLRQFVNGTFLSPENRYARWVSIFNDEAKDNLFLNAENSNETWHNYLNEYLCCTDIQNIHNRVFYTDVKTYLPNNQLEYVDKMSMAHALEVRVPFCDHKLLEFSATIPYQLKIRGLNTKYLLKKASERVLPESIINRKKIGFNAPVGIWFQGALNSYIKEQLSETNLNKSGFFNYKAVKTIMDKHDAKVKDYSLHLWALLVFQVWYENCFSV